MFVELPRKSLPCSLAPVDGLQQGMLDRFRLLSEPPLLLLLVIQIMHKKNIFLFRLLSIGDNLVSNEVLVSGLTAQNHIDRV